MTRLLSLVAIAACGGPSRPASLTNKPDPQAFDNSIRRIDFLNHTYRSNIGDEDQRERITVVNGDFERPGERTGFFHVDAPVYGDIDGDGIEDAIVRTVDNGGGSGNFDVAIVFTMKRGQLVELGHIHGGDRGAGGLVAFAVEPGGVVVTRHELADGEGACCPSKLAIEHWKWDGKTLVIDDKRTQIVEDDR